MEESRKHKYVVEGKLILQLFVSGMSLKSMEAIENIKQLCKEYLQGPVDLQIIDLYKNPELAIEQQIVFSPSLIKQSPLPKKTVIGSFADTERVIKGLGLSIIE
ncbi:MAG: circadian clock KaiB family protein [Ferruginibacter sp.]